MESTGPVLVLLDNGFFRRVTEKNSGENFWRNAQFAAGSHLQEALNDWAPCRTPFAFLEWIGVNTEKLPRPPLPLVSSPVTADFIGIAFDYYLTHYISCAALKPESLRQMEKTQQGYLSESTRHIWDAAIRDIFDAPSFATWVHVALAFDAIHKLDLPPQTDCDFYSELLAHGFFNELLAVRNLSKFRIARRLWQRAFRRFPTDKRAPFIPANAAMDLDNHEDCLDVDLIHLATLGNEDSRCRRKVICLTCDKPEVIKIRISVYRGLVRHARQLYDTEAASLGYPADYETCFNGWVYCFDQSGHLTARIDVSADTCPINFLGHVQGFS